jgi:hypothetical protein
LSAEDGAEKTANCEGRQNANAEMRKTANMKDIVAVAHNLKWKWGGHVAGMEQRRYAHATSMWDVRLGKRRTGRPKTLSRQ